MQNSSMELTETERLLVNSIDEAIILVNPKLEIIQMNARAQSLFELKTFQDLKLTDICQRGVLCQLIHALFKTKQTQHTDLEMGEAAEYRFFEITALHCELRGKAAALLIIRDATDKYRMQEMKENFLRTVSHELRTPLVSIIGYLELVKTKMFGEISEKNAEYVNKALDNGLRLRYLINNALDLTKIESGVFHLEQKTFDLFPLIQQEIESIRIAAKEKGIEVIYAGPEYAYVRADEKCILQVMRNLLDNALKFTDKGAISVSVVLKEQFWLISVTDTGIGIASESQELIFERFKQIDEASTRAHGGSGLGLSIVKEVLALHKIDIKVESVLGVGSTFSFALPSARLSSEV